MKKQTYIVEKYRKIDRKSPWSADSVHVADKGQSFPGDEPIEWNPSLLPAFKKQTAAQAKDKRNKDEYIRRSIDYHMSKIDGQNVVDRITVVTGREGKHPYFEKRVFRLWNPGAK